MPTSKSRRRLPLAPEPPADGQISDYSSISQGDVWEDTRVFSADLSGGIARGLRLVRCELHEVALTGTELHEASFKDVLAIDCDLSGALIPNGSMRRVEFRNCRMAGVVLAQSTLHDVRLRDTKLDGASFRLATAERFVANGCTFVSADFYEAKLRMSAFEDCDLRGSDFTGAAASGLRLSGSNVAELHGPSGLRGATIRSDQVLPLGSSLLAE